MKTTALLSLAALAASAATAHFVQAQEAKHGHHTPHAAMNEKPFVAKHLERSATITLNGGIDTVWPLFDPINESKWVAAWKPEILYPANRVVQEGMVFRTHGTVWVVSRYDVERRRVTYTVNHPDEVHTIDVRCGERGESVTEATVTYSYTGLNDAGNELIVTAAERMFARKLKDWQELINHYLATGEALEVDHDGEHGRSDAHRRHGR